jgi:hypothetical protein
MTNFFTHGLGLAHDEQPVAVTGELGGASLQARFQARWRWLVRRWVFALAGLGVGLSLGWGWMVSLDILSGYRKAVQALQDVQQQLAAQPQNRAAAAPVQPEALTRLPVLGQQAGTWLALKQVLALHRVSVLSLRPLQDLRSASLPNQAVALRLQARFGDWVAAWSGLNQAGPVWSIERIRMSPMAVGGALEIDVVLRVWMREGPERREVETAWVQAASVHPSRGLDVAVFASPQATDQGGVLGDELLVRPLIRPMNGQPNKASAAAIRGAHASEGVPSASLSLVFAPEPERMPFAPWRLLGIWEQAGLSQAFLASDTHWFRVRAGQTISQQGHRLETVAADRVVWRDPQGHLSTLTLESRTP